MFKSIFLFILFSIIWSCSSPNESEDQTIVGNWKLQEVTYTYKNEIPGVNDTTIYSYKATIEFQEDGQFVQTGDFRNSGTGNWKLEADSLFLNYEANEGYFNATIWHTSIKSNTLTFNHEEQIDYYYNGYPYTFTRVVLVVWKKQ